MGRVCCEVMAPAKINLGLQVIGRRPDGYHDILTTFVAINLYDHLIFTRRIAGGVSLEAVNPDRDRGGTQGFPIGEDNLIMRAVRLVERETELHADLLISVRKQIPIAAGLGGGSSDAAATLLGLKHLYDLPVSERKLADWAGRLGSDVPFFLNSWAAEGRGRGEKLRPIRLFRDWWVLMVTPRIFLSAKDVYEGLDLTYGAGAADFSGCRDRGSFLAALRRAHNDLESVVIRRIPEVQQWRDRLRKIGAENVFVSGSGPTAFGVFLNRPTEGAVQLLRKAGMLSQVIMARPVDTPTALVVL